MLGRMISLALSLTLVASASRADMADVSGGQLYYQSCGSGPKAVVLLHDGVLDSASFDDLAARLCKHLRVVRYDRRGYGRSPAAKDPYSPTEDLAAVMRAAGVDHATLAGFSAGGGIALDYALDHPATVDRLILVGAELNGFKVSSEFNKRNFKIALPMIIGNVDGVIANAAKDPYLIIAGHEDARQRAVALSRASPQNIRHQLHDPARSGPSALPRMPSLQTPTLILTGDHDIADVQAMAGAAQVLLPHSRRVVIADAGHLVQLEQAGELDDLIRTFVDRQPSAER